ncbi:LysR family transcriptional regulator [Psychromonas sp. L1A2]|uniref:LysR family transcriptional regulator n=1 Tax=Psychromonas sp. L1A2 TaxID=2686356 RepID=UPI00135A994E|nr:LysR family transcriptional regulator [Psychromonas sp. L1A2]
MLSSLDLHFFYAVATSNSLSAAAKKLNVTPPTVTQRLQTLEAKLSLKLVERDFRRSKLTTSGKKLASRCKLILDEIDLLTDELKEDQTSLAGKLTVLAPLGFGEKYIASIIGDFSIKYPNLKIKLLLSDHPDKASSPEADIIIYIGELKDSSMRRVVLAKNRRLVCASPSYLESTNKIESPELLSNHKCIALVENNEDTMQWSFKHKTSGNISNIRIKPSLVCNVADAVKLWALKDLGIIHRSEWDVRQEIESGRLQEILTDYKLPDADVVALLNDSEKDRPRRVNMFINYLKSSLKEL